MSGFSPPLYSSLRVCDMCDKVAAAASNGYKAVAQNGGHGGGGDEEHLVKLKPRLGLVQGGDPRPQFP